MQPISLFVAAFISCLVFQCVVSVDTPEDDFVEKLCSSSHSRGNTVITLNHSITYNVTSNRSCSVKSTSLTIQSDSLQYPGYVNCVNQVSSLPISTVSFAFLNVSLTVSNVVFSGCGARLSRFPDVAPKLQFNSLHFTDSHSAFFVFIDSEVMFSRVDITNYFGFGTIGINLGRSVFFNSTFNHSLGEALFSHHIYGSIGSGMLILFTETATSLALRSQISINQLIFFANFDITQIKDRQCVVHHFSSYSQKQPSRIINAAALTVIFSNVNRSGEDGPVVSLNQNKFYHNYGSYCSGLMVLLLNSTAGVVKIAQNHFEKNVNWMECMGTHLTFFATTVPQPLLSKTITPLIVVNNTIFENNKGMRSPYGNKGIKVGSLLIGIHNSEAEFEFLFEQVTFSDNEGPLFGTAMAVLVYNRTKASDVRVNVILKSVTVTKSNHISFKEIIVYGGGILAFNDIDNVTVIGTMDQPSNFMLNNGSAIKAVNSNIFLKGHVVFMENKSIRGAALSLIDSMLYFEEGLNLEATNNSVLNSGGAIFVANIGFHTYELPNCALQFPSNNISCNFAHNDASLGGSSIYAYPLYSCYNKEAIVRTLSSYSKYLNFVSENTKVKDMSTQAQTLVKCDYMSYGGFAATHYYPGQTIRIWMHASGNGLGDGNSVYTEVKVRLVQICSSCSKVKKSNSEIKESEKIQAILEDSNNCTLINVTIAYKGNDDEQGRPAIVVSAFMVSAIVHIPQSLFNSSCPPGFQRRIDSGYCECSNAVEEFLRAVYSKELQCDIQNLIIPRPPYIASPWLGNVKLGNKTLFGLTDLCPFSYCTTNIAFKGFRYDEKSQSFKLKSSEGLIDICRDHREGMLCGKCVKNYSAVFGANECMKCSNFWLLTIILYALSGPLIILVLYSLNLTLTAGTINGIVFFGQAANVNVLPFLSYFPAFRISRRFMSVFLSMLNFNLGFPLCFYDGMTEVHKMTLSLVFPIYLFTIIFIIIVASRYSTWLSTRTSSKSVQVLATVVHISMGNLILSATNAFIRVQIYVDDDTTKYTHVWFKYPEASTSDSIILISFTVIVVSVIVVPYFTLLIGGRWLLRYTFYSNNFRAIYEAIHGPYKENRNYWFLARLVLLIIMFVFYTVWRGRELHLIIALTMSVLVLFIVVQECLKPFKNKIVGVLDTTVMMCMVFLYILGWYQTVGLTSPNIMLLYDLLLVPVGIVFLLFLLVLGYHITMTLCPKNRLASLRSLPPIRIINSEQSAFLLSETVKDEEANEKENCDYREPLLSSDSD